MRNLGQILVVTALLGMLTGIGLAAAQAEKSVWDINLEWLNSHCGSSPPGDLKCGQIWFDREIAKAKEGKVPANSAAIIDALPWDEVLLEPDSRRVKILGNLVGGIVCGTVNAKNKFGGYAGPILFVVAFGEDKRLRHFGTMSDPEIEQYRGVRQNANDLKTVTLALLGSCGVQ